MVKVDLITGFLGSGKTTFIRKYAKYLMDEGNNIGILENDYGAVNVDMMLLQDLMGDNCELEMISGGCDKDQRSQYHADEWSNCVISTRFRCPQHCLSTNIEEDAQSVGYETKCHCNCDEDRVEESLANGERDHQRASSREHALQHDYLIGALIGDLASAVVLDAPADRSKNDKDRAKGQIKARLALPRQHDARDNVKP